MKYYLDNNSLLIMYLFYLFYLSLFFIKNSETLKKLTGLSGLIFVFIKLFNSMDPYSYIKDLMFINFNSYNYFIYLSLVLTSILSIYFYDKYKYIVLPLTILMILEIIRKLTFRVNDSFYFWYIITISFFLAFSIAEIFNILKKENSKLTKYISKIYFILLIFFLSILISFIFNHLISNVFKILFPSFILYFLSWIIYYFYKKNDLIKIMIYLEIIVASFYQIVILFI